jgi:hypothetical protein
MNFDRKPKKKTIARTNKEKIFDLEHGNALLIMTFASRSTSSLFYDRYSRLGNKIHSICSNNNNTANNDATALAVPS